MKRKVMTVAYFIYPRQSAVAQTRINLSHALLQARTKSIDTVTAVPKVQPAKAVSYYSRYLSIVPLSCGSTWLV